MPMQWRGTRSRSCAPCTTKRPARDRRAARSGFAFTQSRGATRSTARRCAPAVRRRRARSSRAAAPRRAVRENACRPASVRPAVRTRAQAAFGRIEALDQQIGDAARRRLVGDRAARRRLPVRLWGLVLTALVTAVYARAGAIFHRNYQQDIDRLIHSSAGRCRAVFPRLIPQIRTPDRTSHGQPTKRPAPRWSRPGASPATRAAGTISLAIFHPGGEIAVSWFRGPYPEFVEHCRRNFGRGSEAKHLLWPARVAVNGARATAETNVAILVRQTIEGVGGRSHLERPLPRPAGAPRRRLAHRRARRAVREGPARSGRAVGQRSTR